MGVFARDELPTEHEFLQDQMKRCDNLPFALVFKSQPKIEFGQHLLAIYGVAAPSKGGAGNAAAASYSGGGLHIEIKFFDSYALPPDAYSLHSQFKSIVHFSKVSLQSPSSALCGHYCLYFSIRSLARLFIS